MFSTAPSNEWYFSMRSSAVMVGAKPAVVGRSWALTSVNEQKNTDKANKVLIMV
jgi:hypothetical protein